jgi:flagellar biogenesis protein FliO
VRGRSGQSRLLGRPVLGAWLLCAFFLCPAWHAPAGAQPVAEEVQAALEADEVSPPSTPIRRAAQPQAASPAQPAGISQLLVALGIVIGTILVLRWVATKFIGGRQGSESRAVTVLSRTLLSPKQQLLLLQVGRRVVLVANCGTQMNPLCEIHDADEVAELIGRIEQEKGESLSSTFSSMFRREKSAYPDPPALTDASDPSAHSMPEAMDPALSGTRDELSGLMEKVRLVSRQLR